MDSYRKELVSYIARREIKDRAFASWLCWFDDHKEEYYASLTGNSDEKLEEAILNQEEAQGGAAGAAPAEDL